MPSDNGSGGSFAYDLTNAGQSRSGSDAGSNNVFNIGGNPNVGATLTALAKNPTLQYALIGAAILVVVALVWRKRK